MDFGAFYSQSVSIKYGKQPDFVPALVTQANTDNEGRSTLKLVVNGAPFIQLWEDNPRFIQAITHVTNFRNFYCTGAGSTDLRHEGKRIGRVTLNSGPWVIVLQGLPNTREIVAQLKGSGGNAITHVAKLSRVDGSTFSLKELDEAIRNLHWLLSFARGSWISVWGTSGFNEQGAPVYVDWSQRMTAPWQNCRSWFDENHGEAIGQLYPGFVSMLDGEHSKAAPNALHWFLRSNGAGRTAGIDGGLILSQAALESIATSIIQSRNIALRKGSNAADKMRIALKEVGVSSELPATLLQLSAGKCDGWYSDGPGAITFIRNELVHPKRKSPSISTSIADAWKLAQWYIEVILLRLSGFGGQFSNRLQAQWVGEVQPFSEVHS